MSHQQVLKKLRKEMRKDLAKKYADFYDYARTLSFWQNLQVAWQVLFGKKR